MGRYVKIVGQVLSVFIVLSMVLSGVVIISGREAATHASGNAEYVLIDTTKIDVKGALATSGINVIEDYGSFVMAEVNGAQKQQFEMAGVLTELPDLYNIMYNKIEFDVRDGPPTDRLMANAPGDEFAQDYYFVKMFGPVKEDWKAEIELTGAEIYSAIPFNAFLVKMDAGQKASVEINPHVLWVGHFGPAYKVAPEVAASGGEFRVNIITFPQQREAVMARLAKMLAQTNGASIISTESCDLADGAMGQIAATMDAWTANTVALLPGVMRIEKWEPSYQCNDVAHSVTQSLGSVGGGAPSSLVPGSYGSTVPVWNRGIFGTGQVIGGSDTGLRVGHNMFRDTLVSPPYNSTSSTHRKIIRYYPGYWNNWDTPLIDPDQDNPDDHGTHIAGSAVGYDNPVGGASNYDGMAPGAKISFCDIGNGDPDGYVHPPNDYSLMWDPAVELDGARIFYQPWGSSYQSTYTSDNAVIDQYVWEHPQLLMLWPTGGEGITYAVGNQAASKNVLTIGSSGTSVDEAAASVATFSSRGPTYDLRLKPDILTPGTLISSADGDTTSGYVAVPGSSMSTGIAAGSASLAVEYFMGGFYPTGSKVAGNSFDPSAALIKAVLSNSAEESTTYTNPYRNYYNTGTTGSWPSVDQGWGRMCLDSTLYFAGDAGNLQVADCDRGLSTGEYIEYKYRVTANTAPLRISLCWNDYPAMPGAGIALVNDLNLLVTSPSGAQYKGNVFSGSNPASSLSGGSYDARNNIEHFRLPSGSASLQTGIWTVRVSALNVQYGPQPFGLAVNGALDLDYGRIEIDQPVYSESGTAQVRIEDAGAGAGPLTAHAYSTGTGDWEAVTCTQSGTGVYLGTMGFTLNAVSKNNSALTVRDGDSVVFFYDDVTGMVHRSYANATIDATGPVMTNIRAEEISHVTALIKWSNSENANGTVYYGQTTALGFKQEEATPFTANQELMLTGLAPNMLYYYDVESWDMYGHKTRATNGGSHYTFKTVPRGDVLVVISDDEGFNATFVEECYGTALSTMGWTYNIWKCYQQGTPTLAELQSYKAVIWQVGVDKYPPFDAAERLLIQNYNNGGGRLWVNSHDVAWAFGDTALSDFYSLEANYWMQGQLKVNWQADPATWGSITGITGDPISGAYIGGFAYYPVRAGGAGDEIDSVAAGGTPTYVWRDGTDDIAVKWVSSAANGTAGIGTWGGTPSRIVTYCFEWFRLGSTAVSNTARTDILDKTLIWLLGRDHPDVTVSAPNGGEVISTPTTPISWTRTTYGGTSVLNTTLYYSPNSGQAWYKITTLTPGTSPYSWTVSGLPSGNQYLVKAEVRDSGSPGYVGSDISNGIFTLSGIEEGPIIVPGTQVTRPIPVVMGGTMWFNGTVDDSFRGNQLIAAAEFFVDGTGPAGTGTAMSAVDGAFNNTIEAVTWSGVCALTEGEHVLRMRGRDAAGYWGLLENTTFQVVPGPEPPYAIGLAGKAAGSWAFVSFPVNVSGSIQDVLDDSTYSDGQTTWDVAKWYNPLTPSDPWKTYRFGSAANDLGSIDNRMGVWLHLTANSGDQRLTLGRSGQYENFTQVYLRAGWNMVGYPCATPRIASGTLPAEADIVSVYSNVTPYVEDRMDLSGVTMSPGNAYWVHVNSDCVWIVLNGTAPLLTIDKTAPATANPGETVMYTIGYANIGTDTAYDVTLTDTYPAGVTFIDANPAPAVMNNIWMLGNIPPGASGFIFINASVNPTATGMLVNEAEAQYDDALGNPQAPVSDTAVTVVIRPLMQFAKTGPATASPGEIIIYTLSYQNIGTDWAYGVSITDLYPADTVFISAIPAPSMGNNVWFIGNVAPGGSDSVTVMVMIDPGASGSITNSAYLDYDYGRVWSNWTTGLGGLFIQLSKTAPATANPGEVIAYTITCTNVGLATACNITITDTYPANVTYLNSVPLPTMGNNVWVIPFLAAGNTYAITVTVGIYASACGVLQNYAEAQFEDVSGNPQVPVYAAAFTIIDYPLMQFTKSAPATAQPGETITYWLNYTNIGTDWACGAVVTEYYPPDVAFISSMPPPDLPPNVWMLGSIAPGAGGAILITVGIMPVLEGTLLNNSASLEYESFIGTGYMEWAFASTLIQLPAPSWPVHNLDTDEYFETIQGAISDNDTLDGHTIEVSAGTYTGQIGVSKSLTIRGAGTGSTILTGGNFTINEGSGDGSDISGFTFNYNGLRMYASRCLLHDIVSENNTYGLYMDWPVHSTIRDCIFRNNGMGMYEYHCYACTIRNCIFENNTGYAIKLQGGEGEAIDFNIFYNQFWFNNGATTIYDPGHNQAQDGLDPESGYSNRWDDSVGHGNYWCDWTTPDANSDGIVDVPYTIYGWRGSQDMYPLTSPIAQEDELPMITQTMPCDGSSQISINISSYSINFDRPMNTSAGSISTNLPGAAWSWSADGRWYNATFGTLSYTKLYYVDLTGRGFEAMDEKPLAGDTYLNFVTSYPPAPWAIATGPNATSSNPRPTITYIFGNSPSYVLIYYKKSTSLSWTTWGTDNTVDGTWVPGSDLPSPDTYQWNVRAMGTGSQEWFPTGDSYVEAGPYYYVITSAPAITVSKTVDRATAAPREYIYYDIYYNNTGNGTADWVQVTDVLPDGVTFFDAIPAPTDITGRTVEWAFTNVAPGSHVIHLIVTVNIGIPQMTLLDNLATCDYSPDGTHTEDWANCTASWLCNPYLMYGYVRDNYGNPHVGAIVTVSNCFTGEWLNCTTNSLGQYSVDLSALPSGYLDDDLIELTTSAGGYNCTWVDVSQFGERVDIIIATADTTAPGHSNEAPPNGWLASNNTPVISVDVTDLQSGVNASTIRFYIQGFSVMYDIHAISDGYTVSYWHEAGFISGTAVSCRIVARDYAGNLLDWTWSFTVP